MTRPWLRPGNRFSQFNQFVGEQEVLVNQPLTIAERRRRRRRRKRRTREEDEEEDEDEEDEDEEEEEEEEEKVRLTNYSISAKINGDYGRQIVLFAPSVIIASAQYNPCSV